MYNCFYSYYTFWKQKICINKRKKFYHKLLRLRLRTRILVIILAWIFSAAWIVIADKYNYKEVSILGIGPFVIICCGVVNIPLWEYLRKKILKSSYSDSIKEWLNYFTILLTAFIELIAFFIIGFCIILAKFLHWI